MDKNNISFEDRSFYSMDTLPTEMVVEWGRAGNYKKIGGAAGKNKKYFNSASLSAGRYGMVVFSPAKRRRPGRPKKNLITVKVKAHSIGGETLFKNYFTLELRRNPLVEFDFEIEEKDAPATLSVSLTAHHVMVGIKVALNISRYRTNNPFFSTFDFQDLNRLIQQNLSISSPELEMARRKRLDRPFLYLSSLHPHTRDQIAATLDVKISPEASLHEEVWELLIRRRKGLCDRNRNLGTKLIRSTKAGNWQSLILGMLEENCLLNMINYASKRFGHILNEDELDQLELDAIEKIAMRSHRVIEDKKLPGEDLIDELCESTLIKKEIFDNLNKGGITDPIIHRFVIELVVRYREQPDDQKNIPRFTPEDVVMMLKARIFSPVRDSMMANRAKRVAKKAAIIVAKVGICQAVLMVFLPPLGFAFLGWNIANFIFGSTMSEVSAVVLQLLSQKLLLAAQGIYVPMETLENLS